MAYYDLNTGQSNSQEFGWWQSAKLASDVGRLIGKQVTNLTEANTSFGGVSLIPVPNPIDGGTYPAYLKHGPTPDTWAPDTFETLRNAAMRAMGVKPTDYVVINWMHNESDSTAPLFAPTLIWTADQWESAARYAIGDMRRALGTDAAHSPVIFTTIPFQKSVPHDIGNAVIAEGMQRIIDDPTMHAYRGPDVSDMIMNEQTPPGGAHMTQEDAALLESRLAPVVARVLSPAFADVAWHHRDGTHGISPSTIVSTGPSFLTSSYVDQDAQGVVLAASTGGKLLVTGAGMDAIQAFGANNVLDGGTGSNWLVGGEGINNTFFSDLRGEITWNTILNFHAGDLATMWGYKPGVSNAWFETGADGAIGHTGATLRVAANGGKEITGSVTFAGLRPDQLVTSTGTQAAGDYLAISFKA